MKTDIKIAQEYGITYAQSMYSDYLEYPEYQGANFNWLGFPETVACLAEVSLFMNFPKFYKKSEEKQLALKAISGMSALREALKLIREQLDEMS